MKTIYFDKNTTEWNIFEQKNNSLYLLTTFQPNNDKACTDFLKKLPPAHIFCIEKNNDFSFWHQIQKSHNPLDWIQHIQINNSVCHIADYRLILVLSALAMPKISERNYQEGVTLIFEENKDFFAVLTYKNQIFGAFEHNIQQINTNILKRNLEEFRFGWLPDEEVRKQNGTGCILKDISAEAEGFRPTFIFCKHKEYFPELGRFMNLEIHPENNINLIKNTI